MSPFPRARARFLCGLALALFGCTAVRPAGVVARAASVGPGFSHAELDDVLQRFVDERGLVDYRRLTADPAQLERYHLALTARSPDSDRALFPTPEDQLAYWINAYNASVFSIVVAYYPIASVTDVSAPFPLWVFSDEIGFFVLQRVTLGGQSMSLHSLEGSIIRGRFSDPRVHFALNRASRGGPRLERSAFTGAALDEQLDRAAKGFFAEERNLRIDHAERIVYLSSILDWYEGDFTGWLAARRPDRPATLLEYVALYAPPDRAADLARARDYSIRFVPYDWSLNDRSVVIGGSVAFDSHRALR